MSGSGGSSGRVDIEVGSGGGSPSDVCGSLDIETTLNSPVAAVVKNLRRGDELDVAVEVSSKQVRTLVAKDGQGRIAGSLTPPSLVAIINCMDNGYQYVAIVLGDVDGGVVRVRIRGKR